jgi:hypothetical protein
MIRSGLRCGGSVKRTGSRVGEVGQNRRVTISMQKEIFSENLKLRGYQVV